MSEPRVLNKKELDQVWDDIQVSHVGMDGCIRTQDLTATIRKLQSDFDIVGTELSRQERENERLRGLLKWLENIMGDLTDGNCRICGRDMYDGHASDCELARALGGE